MARKLKDVIASLPIERQNAIHQGAQRLIAEELHRRNHKKNVVLSQQNKSGLVNGDRKLTSRNKPPADTHINTLSAFVEAMGGDLARFARFPDRPAVQIRQLEFLEAVKAVKQQYSNPKRDSKYSGEQKALRQRRKGSMPLR